MSRYSSWSNTIQKVRAHLSKWKVKTLSMGGRLTLLKSVLGAVPIYNMSLFKTPKRVLHEMEMICNSFFALNRALLFKWIWRFLSQDGSLWYHVICVIHGVRLEQHSRSSNSTWGAIIREAHLLASKGFDFLSHCKIRVGDVSNTRFWLDNWILDSPLYVRFPRLFALESVKDISMAVKWGAPSLDASFRRRARDGAESNQWSDFYSMLDLVTLSSSPDRTFCDLNGEGVLIKESFFDFVVMFFLASC
nr:RNA-directed DNA polymerase, eukaryota, reverse transcriptase zinc-binding domain protein [Tanacetum cinerariifolium]